MLIAKSRKMEAYIVQIKDMLAKSKKMVLYILMIRGIQELRSKKMVAFTIQEEDIPERSIEAVMFTIHARAITQAALGFTAMIAPMKTSPNISVKPTRILRSAYLAR